MKNIYITILLLLCSNAYASENPFAVEYELKNVMGPNSTETTSFTTIVLPNNTIEIPQGNNVITILIENISETEVLVRNTFIVNGNMHEPNMKVTLGQNSSYQVGNVSLILKVSKYQPENV